MELHELEIGKHRSGPVGQSQAVAGGEGRVGGLAPGRAAAAGGEHGCAGAHGVDLVAMAVGRAADAPGIAQQVDGEGVVDDGDARVGAHGCGEGAGDLGPGGVTVGVQDAAGAVAAFAGQVRRPVRPAVEAAAGLAQEVHRLGGRADDRPRGRFIAQAGSGGQGVLDVQRDIIVRGAFVGPQYRRHPALGPGGVRQAQFTLAQHQHFASGLGRGEGGGKAGDAAADDQHLGLETGTATRVEAHQMARTRGTGGDRGGQHGSGRYGPGRERYGNNRLAASLKQIPRWSKPRNMSNEAQAGESRTVPEPLMAAPASRTAASRSCAIGASIPTPSRAAWMRAAVDPISTGLA